MQFRHAFVEKRLSEETLVNNCNRKALDLLLNTLYMIVTKRIPEEILDKLDTKTFKIDNVYNKINLVSIPETVVTKDTW